MRIQTVYMTCKNCWTINSSYNFQVHQQYPPTRCCFSQTAEMWVKVLPELSPALPDISLPLSGLLLALPELLLAHRGAPRCTRKVSLVLRGVPKLITITPMVLLKLSSEIPAELKAGWNAHPGCDTLGKLTYLSLHYTSSQTHLESSSN
jgi:hypothetical protein